MSTDDSRRLFFAVWPEAAAAGRLHDAARLAQRTCGGRVMTMQSLHLTLAFLGQVAADRMADLQHAAAGVRAAPFDLCIDVLGCWQHNRIVWAGCSGPPAALSGLARTLAVALADAGFPTEARAFMPHVTLLRGARCAPLPPLEQAIAWPVRAFHLVESHPHDAGYKSLVRWPLATALG